MTESKGEWCEEKTETEQLVSQDCPDLTSGNTYPLLSNFHGISREIHIVYYQGHGFLTLSSICGD